MATTTKYPEVKTNRPAQLGCVIPKGFRHCHGCNAMSAHDRDGTCRMCLVRGGPITAATKATKRKRGR